MTSRKRRVLFIGEAVTLSHVARPVALAGSLDPSRYDVILACDPRYGFLLRELAFPLIELKSSIPQERLLEVLEGRQPLFDVATLEAYVKEDLKLIEEHKPDLIVGDMRQSLAVSSQLSHVTYVNIINAQWSRYSDLELELPSSPLEGLLGTSLAQLAQRLVVPMGLASHAIPMNVVSLKYGLPPPGLDIKQTFSLGDFVVYPDIPEILPTRTLPATHSYIGPILWSPATPLPEWWNQLKDDLPIVYLNLGSSGQQNLLELVLEALAPLPIVVIAATAGKVQSTKVPHNARVADYLPGDLAARRARMVICNGGNMSGQQALSEGAPILGIASNMDQMVFARAVSRTGAGEVMRETEVSAASLRRVVWRMIAEQKYRDAAARIAEAYTRMTALDKFPELVDRIFSEQTPNSVEDTAETA